VPRWIYFSSISERALEYHDEMADWLKKNPGVKLAFQPGTFQMKAGTERLKHIYEQAEFLILNREEAVIVGGGDRDNVNDLLDRMHGLGAKMVVITDGPKGLYASDGSERWFMPIYPDLGPPLERTGAGDACASTIVAALMKGKALAEAIMWGPINSMNVVQHVGAQEGLLSEDKLVEFLNKAPEWYRPKPM
jgi:sugar/nucleoside kinase (ribokinase family)